MAPSRNHWTSLAGVIALSALVGSCSLGGPLRTDERALGGYHIGRVGSGWKAQREEDPGIDYAWTTDSGAFVSLGSVCRRYDRAPLEALSKDLVNPLEDREIISEERRPLDDREALHVKARGRMDGVPVEAHYVVFRKDDCLFDFSLIARDRVVAADDKAFEAFVSGFHFGGSR